MKNYTITVNGNVYDVTVEEKGAGAAPVAPAAPKAAPKAAPAPAPKAAPAGAGSIQVKAGAAGKVFSIEKVQVQHRLRLQLQKRLQRQLQRRLRKQHRQEQEASR